MPESGHRQPLAISLETPPGLDARTLASAVLQFMQVQYGATVETRHEAERLRKVHQHERPERPSNEVSGRSGG